MAELILKVGSFTPTHQYQDGDIVHAPNDRQIGGVHIDHICDVRKTGFTGDGLRPDSLAREQRELVYQYKFERISVGELQRTDLVTGEVDILSATPNEKGEAIDVEQFITRRKAHKAHAVFGIEGAEYWYGGRLDRSKAKVDQVWKLIEGNTALRRKDHSKWPLGKVETAHFCALSVGDYTDGMANAMLARSEVAPDVSVSDRLCHVEYNELDDIAGPLRNLIADRSQHIDVRDFALFAPEDIVRIKGL